MWLTFAKNDLASRQIAFHPVITREFREMELFDAVERMANISFLRFHKFTRDALKYH